MSSSGQLQTDAALDYETKNTYSVTVTVSDGSLTDTIAVIINVPYVPALIGDRTPQVRDAILDAVPGVSSEDDITKAHLAAITSLDLRYRGITALKIGDFDGLTALTTLDLSYTNLSSLPVGVFSGLTSLTTLKLNNNRAGPLRSLPAGIFSGLTSLTYLNLHRNLLSSLPSDIFSDLTSLTYLNLSYNGNLRSLPAFIFSGLTSLETLHLYGNLLSSLPDGIFSGLTSLTYLSLSQNVLRSLPDGIFSDLTAIETLKLNGNKLSSLPDGIFSGLTKLSALYLRDNEVDPLPFTVSLEKVMEGQFKAVAPIGAPFNFVLPISTNNGTIDGNATSLTILKGGVESESFTVTRPPGTTGVVTVDIGAPLPKLPSDHSGYNLVKSEDLPLTVIDAGVVDNPTVTIGVPSETQTGAFDATITFSETVSDFTQSDVSLTGSAASITAWNANSDDTVYTATITPTASGTVTIAVAADVATDAAGNPNTEATAQTVAVDIDKPTVTIGVLSETQTGAFDATITFSETVSGFEQADVSLTGSAASITEWNANSDNTVYTATITPTASGTVMVSVDADVATDAAGNPNTEATSQAVAVDIDKPSATIGVPSGTQTGAFDAPITFSETVSGFTQSDVSLAGSAASITAWSANSDNTVYTATITPTASGTVTVGVAADVATDAAGNPNTEATSQTVSVDVDKPTVSIGVPSGTQTGAFDATVTFSETVSGFEQADVSLSGSAASIAAWIANSDNSVYTATITPTASGTVTVGVAVDVATDAAGNPNTEATSQTVSVDVDKPTVSTGVPSGTQTGAFEATVTFSETVSDFTQSDVSLSGSAASITGWRSNSSNTIYTATITPTASGTVTVSVGANVATDAAGNPNTAATAQTITIEIPPAIPDPATWMPDADLRSVIRGALGLATDATFTQAQLGQLTELWASQSGIGNLTGLEYAPELTTLSLWRNSISDLTPLQDLTKLSYLRLARNAISDVSPLSGLTALTSLGLQHNNIVDVAPLATLVNLTWLRLAGNAITDLSPLVTLVKVTDSDVDLPDPDTTAPGVGISVPSGIQNGVFDATITFTESVSGFVQADLSLSGTASVTAWRANSNNTVYTATITPTASGTVTVSVAANVATDAANNPNTAATSQTVPVDVDKPSVTINVPSGVQTGVFNVTITFTETVSGFTQSDVSLSGSAASITGWRSNSNNTVYTATITPTASGTVMVSVVANVATDTAGNSNTAATSKTVTVSVDTNAPNVSISVPSGVQNGAFDVTVTFTESVSGFVQSDLSLSGTASASITAWNPSNTTTYTATVTPTSSESVTLNVNAGVATDAANNPNTAAMPKTVTVDIDSPTVTIGVPSGTQTGAFDATITFSETVSGFTQSDVSLSGSAANITGWRSNSNNTVYTATITPTASGTVMVSVAANVATDTAGNSNTAATSKTVTVSVDTNAPNVSISVPSGVQNGAFSATITFTESVSGFTQSDLSLTGTASITAWNATDNTTYTATITLTTSGTITLNVNAGVATDAANNPNTAATPKTVTVDIDSPTVTIGVPSGTQTGAFDATITFSETVSGFTQSDVSLSGSAASITGWRSNSNNTVYTATITPTASGTVTISVAANVVTDVANNPNTAATSQTVTIALPEVTPDPVTSWMPDANLRAAVRKELGLTDNETLTQAKMLDVGILEAPDSQIADLTGLEYATNLKYLILDRNNISNLTPLRALTKLEELKLGRNNVSDVSPLGGITTLERLRLTRNNVMDATPLRNLVNLEWLRIKGNKNITNLHVLAGLPKLTDVDITIPDPPIGPQLRVAPARGEESSPPQTLLLPNYPNPFNPDTWIPYHLANDTDVQITIYDARGAVIRRLALGHQRAGVYQSRRRAAYWDGTNETGARVSSGIYFYQLQADNVSRVRKMVILK